MKFHFRVTLLALVIGLILLTVTTVGVAAYVNSGTAAERMAVRVQDQTSRSVDQQVDKILGEAVGQAALSRRLLQTGQLQSRDFTRIVAYWRESLAVSPNVASLYVGLADTGECVGVSRLSGERFTVWESTRNASGRLEQREYLADDYPGPPTEFDPTRVPPDIRTRPWFVAAEREKKAVWTDTFVFLGLQGMRTVFGLTYCVPVYRPDGKLEAVVAADFDLNGLSRFLNGLRVGETGLACLVEVQADGRRRVIAHPNADLLLRPAADGGPAARELVPADEFPDDRVRALLGRIPPGDELEMRGATGRVDFETAAGDGFLASYRQLGGDDRPPWLICTLLSDDEVLGHARRMNRWTALIALVVLGLAVVATVAVARQVARPLEALADETAAIGQFRLQEHPPVRSFVREVDRLGAATEEMKAGLRSFGKYVPADLVRLQLQSGREAQLGGDRRTLTLLFSDIAGFTTLAETMPAEVLVEHLGEYLSAMSGEVLAAGGTVDKYIGDAVMAFWGAPTANPDHAAAACAAALRCQKKLRELREGWRAAGRPLCPTRIGLHTGEVVVGNIGSAARLNYTAVGDAVNLASRLEGLNKRYGTECLASEETIRQAGPGFVARPLDWVSVAGRTAGVLVYELLGTVDECDPAVAAFADRYATALAAYRRREWDAAMGMFDAILERRPADGPARLMVARCAECRADPPGDDWDGISHMTSK